MNNTTVTTLTTDEIETLDREITYCRNAQSFANGTRSQWLPELEEIREAAGAASKLAEAIEVADREAERLATIVARRLVDADEIRERLYADTTDEQDAAIADLDVAGLVAWMRSEDITLDDAGVGVPDGYTINEHEASAYATCRTWRGPDAEPRWVEINLLDTAN